MKTVYVTLERWNLDLLETDANVFTTEKAAREHLEKEAIKVVDMVSNGVIRHRGDDDMNYDCDICVENAEGDTDEWWEANIVTRVVKG